MEYQIINIDAYEFCLVFTKQTDTRWVGMVLEVETYTDGTYSYRSNEDDGIVDSINNARVWFKWRLRWRGVWDSTVSFPCEQFSGLEVRLIQLVWDKIEYVVKERIKTDNPSFVIL